jgi:DNA-binding CsgD family transcriptional regulator
VEVPSLLAEAQLSGDMPLPEPLPAGDAVREAFRREISRLSRKSSDALLILAADDGGALDAVQDALETTGLSMGALAPSERQGLVRIIGEHAEFRHPLLRSAVYHGSTPAHQRRAHDALARAYATRDEVRHAWHRAAAAPGPDDSIASALEAAAADASSRGGHGSAASALERAAELTPKRAEQARRRYQAGVSATLSGESRRAQRNLDAALRLTTDPLMRADIQRARGLVLYTSGSLVDAYELLVAEAQRVQGSAPERAVAMLTDACTVCSGSADVAGGLRAARMATAIARRADREAQLLAALALVQPLILGGRTKEALRLLKASRKNAADYFGRSGLNPFHPVVAVSYTYLDHAFGRQLLDTVHETARTRSPQMLPQVLATLTHVDITFGEWPLALAHATEGSELAGVLGQEGTRAFALATLATIEAGMGREEARTHADQAIELAARSAARSMQAYGCHAIGLLDLGRGRLDGAVAALEESARLMREWGIVDPLLIPWIPNLVEAYVHSGRLPLARTLVTELAELAGRTGMPWAEATAERCTGLVAEDFDGPFLAALDLYDRLPGGFDRARTELAYAERLRRSGRRREARTHLHTAIEVFRRLGASPWQERAEAELGSTAEQIHARSDPMQGLSPQELQVALLVGSGATNREAAAALFITAKTVEYHLGHVYQKLGVRSRTELAVCLASREKGGNT